MKMVRNKIQVVTLFRVIFLVRSNEYVPVSRVIIEMFMTQAVVPGGVPEAAAAWTPADSISSRSAEGAPLFTTPCLERQHRISGKTTSHSPNSRLCQRRARDQYGSASVYAICWRSREPVSHRPSVTSCDVLSLFYFFLTLILKCGQSSVSLLCPSSWD